MRRGSGRWTVGRNRLAGRRCLTIYALLSLFCAASHIPTVCAQGINSWIQPDGGDYGVAANWSLNRVPTATDDVVFGLDATYGVRSDIGRTADSISVARGTVVVDFDDINNLWRAQNASDAFLIGTSPGETATLMLFNGTYRDNSNSALRTVGAAPGSHGRVVVSSNARWGHSGGNTTFLSIGFHGKGTVIVESNGVVDAEGIWIGDENIGELSVRHNGTVTADARIDIGAHVGGHGDVVISENGLLEQTFGNGSINIGGTPAGSAGTGNVELYDSGRLRTAATSTLNIWQGGSLHVLGGAVQSNRIAILGGELEWADGRIEGTTGGAVQQFDVGRQTTERSSFSIGNGRTLNVSGAFTVADGSTAALDGGTLRVGTLQKSGLFEFNAGTLAITGENLTITASGDLGANLRLEDDMRLDVTQMVTVADGGTIQINGGLLIATGGLSVNAGGRLEMLNRSSLLQGGTISNSGIIQGEGRISNSLTNQTTGEVIVAERNHLQFSGSSNMNSGDIFVDNGTLRFDGQTMNSASGRVLGRGELFFTGGLTSSGVVHFDAGTTDIHGELQLADAARTIISANGVATFFDDVTNNGELFHVREGASAVFLGTLSGQGIDGDGRVFLDGTLQPGQSPGQMRFGGDLQLGTQSTTEIEILGRTAGSEYDQVSVEGQLILNGTLSVSLGEPGTSFEPVFGDVFEILQFGEAGGDFVSYDLPALPDGTAWQAENLIRNGRLYVISSVPGDADGDGAVNLIDFNILKSNFGRGDSDWFHGDFDADGTAALSDFNILKANFGATGQASAVPEPSAIVLLGTALMALAALHLRNRREP